MKDFLIYLFWPNPGPVPYENTKVLILLSLGAVLCILAFALSVWRKKQGNPVLKSLSKSWPSAAGWIGVSAIVLTLARAEGVQYVSMRILWGVWLILILLYLWLQVRLFRAKYYERLPSATVSDPRSKYLPRKKKR